MDNQNSETKKCKYCQTDIPKKAKICPNCKKKQDRKVKWIIIGIIVIIILGGAFGNSDSSSNKDNTTQSVSNSQTAVSESENEEPKSEEPIKEESKKEEPEKEEVQEYIEITSTELISAYDSNQVKCKQLYDGKMLKVTGTVTSVGTDIMNDVYVCLGHDTEYTFVGIQCYAKDADTENKIAELSEGDVITVIGTGSCGSMAFSLKNAEIVD